MKETEKCTKCLKGVSCDATNCVYNGKNNTCHAAEISVGPHSACSSAETICATFKPKDEVVG